MKKNVDRQTDRWLFVFIYDTAHGQVYNSYCFLAYVVQGTSQNSRATREEQTARVGLVHVSLRFSRLHGGAFHMSHYKVKFEQTNLASTRLDTQINTYSVTYVPLF